MFQLIVAVISIALVAALAIASIYYGGSAFSSSSLRANVVTLVNAGQQISGAQALYKTDYGVAGTMVQLKESANYLSSEPGKSPIVKKVDGVSVDWTLATVSGSPVAQIGIVDNADNSVCAEVLRQAGSNGLFFCEGTTDKTFNFKL